MDTVNESTELGQLMHLAEPFMWVESANVTGYCGQLALRGMPKYPGPADAYVTSRQVRQVLLDQTEALIDALAEQGWQLVDSFRVEFVTEVRNFAQTVTGVLMQPSEQRGVTATLELRVGRAR